MGLIESTIKELYYDPTSYGRLARDEFDTMTSNLERTISKNETINKKMIEKQYDEILMKLQLPSDMAEQLFKNPLTNDIEKSGDFIKEYLEKYYLFRDFYFMMIHKHEQIISDASVDQSIDIEKFLEKKHTYPEDLQKALDGMVKQNIYPDFHSKLGGTLSEIR